MQEVVLAKAAARERQNLGSESNINTFFVAVLLLLVVVVLNPGDLPNFGPVLRYQSWYYVGSRGCFHVLTTKNAILCFQVGILAREAGKATVHPGIRGEKAGIRAST